MAADMSIRKLTGGLPQDLQEIVLLRFRQNLTIREIAAAPCFFVCKTVDGKAYIDFKMDE